MFVFLMVCYIGKDPGGIFLNCLLEDEAKQIMKYFHKGVCGGHFYWKARVNKNLRANFSDVHKEVTSCHECKIFEGKIKLLSLPLKSIYVEALFQ